MSEQFSPQQERKVPDFFAGSYEEFFELPYDQAVTIALEARQQLPPYGDVEPTPLDPDNVCVDQQGMVTFTNKDMHDATFVSQQVAAKHGIDEATSKLLFEELELQIKKRCKPANEAFLRLKHEVYQLVEGGDTEPVSRDMLWNIHLARSGRASIEQSLEILDAFPDMISIELLRKTCLLDREALEAAEQRLVTDIAEIERGDWSVEDGRPNSIDRFNTAFTSNQDAKALLTFGEKRHQYTVMGVGLRCIEVVTKHVYALLPTDIGDADSTTRVDVVNRPSGAIDQPSGVIGVYPVGYSCYARVADYKDRKSIDVPKDENTETRFVEVPAWPLAGRDGDGSIHIPEKYVESYMNGMSRSPLSPRSPDSPSELPTVED